MIEAKLSLIEQEARNMALPNPLGIWMTKVRVKDLKWMVDCIRKLESELEDSK